MSRKKIVWPDDDNYTPLNVVKYGSVSIFTFSGVFRCNKCRRGFGIPFLRKKFYLQKFLIAVNALNISEFIKGVKNISKEHILKISIRFIMWFLKIYHNFLRNILFSITSSSFNWNGCNMSAAACQWTCASICRGPWST